MSSQKRTIASLKSCLSFAVKTGYLQFNVGVVIKLKKATQRAAIAENVSPHWMRHAHATHSLENGAPITLVKDILGHKSIETTAKYTHVRPNASSGQFLKV